jgi:hypothetical protein
VLALLAIQWMTLWADLSFDLVWPYRTTARCSAMGRVPKFGRGCSGREQQLQEPAMSCHWSVRPCSHSNVGSSDVNEVSITSDCASHRCRLLRYTIDRLYCTACRLNHDLRNIAGFGISVWRRAHSTRAQCTCDVCQRRHHWAEQRWLRLATLVGSWYGHYPEGRSATGRGVLSTRMVNRRSTSTR